VRRGRSFLGGLAGVVWGLGGAVLTQQTGVLPLDAPLLYGLPLAAAFISGTWARARARRAALPVAALVVVVAPLAMLVQGAGCDVIMTTDAGTSGSLSGASIGSPLLVDPATDGAVRLDLTADDLAGTARYWVEFGGLRITAPDEAFTGSGSQAVYPLDDGFLGLPLLPGLYHVGGEIDGVCSGDGYVRVAGSPFANPVGIAASAAVVLGLLGTWAAGRVGASAAPPITLRLDPRGRPVHADGVLVESPGLEGDIEVYRPPDPTVDARLGWSPEVHEALARHRIKVQRVIELSQTAEIPDAAAPIITPLGEPALSIEVPSPRPGFGQLMIATDEGGVCTWTCGEPATVGQGFRRYVLARAVSPDDEPSKRPAAFRAFGSKLLSVVVFPILDPVFGKVGEHFARRWEQAKRPYRLRSFTPDDFDAPATGAEIDWDLLASGPTLLMIHGTFSQTHTGFGELSPQVVGDLNRLYDGRVLAFDHPTLTEDPRQNVAWLLAQVPRGLHLDVDIVCHSRGGLVSRVLAERQRELAGGHEVVAVDKVVFVASPNAGTILANPDYMSHLVDSYTNILNFTPGPLLVESLEAVITVVKHLAVGAVAGLPGLAAMRPGGPFLSWLNVPAGNGSGRYYAITGDYAAPSAGLRRHAADRVMDKIFAEANDLVVPTAGVHGANGSSRFPVAKVYQFTGVEGVDHGGYFANKVARDKLLDWLAE
jgi:hypothetical protein